MSFLSPSTIATGFTACALVAPAAAEHEIHWSAYVFLALAVFTIIGAFAAVLRTLPVFRRKDDDDD